MAASSRRLLTVCWVWVLQAAVLTAGAPDRESVRTAVLQAGDWLAANSGKGLRFDAAIGLSAIRRHVDSDSLRRAWVKALEVAGRDTDNPIRRFWDPEATASPRVTAGWEIPGPEERRINTNRPVAEALHCRENGWRAETSAYVSGRMRDGGGYHSTHGLWSLTIAYANGCIPAGDYGPAAAVLLEEIAEAQARSSHPEGTAELDLFAERLLVTLLADPASDPAPEWAARLLSLQNADGSWGACGQGVDTDDEYHATMIAAWALAEYGAIP